MKAEEITKGSTLLATLNKENYPFGMHKDLIKDLNRMINLALNTPVVSQQRELFKCECGYSGEFEKNQISDAIRCPRCQTVYANL
jgi:predicted Zn-ribbon and HTH transcriptional regulator